MPLQMKTLRYKEGNRFSSSNLTIIAFKQRNYPGVNSASSLINTFHQVEGKNCINSIKQIISSGRKHTGRVLRTFLSCVSYLSGQLVKSDHRTFLWFPLKTD